MYKTMRIMLAVFLAFTLLPASARERGDTVYVFRFEPGKDMFYVAGNDAELARLGDYLERYKGAILAGEMPLYVEGYCSSGGSQAKSLALAKIRSNRVKSEMIVKQGLTEDCFVTKNRAEGGDYVAVRVVVPEAVARELGEALPEPELQPEVRDSVVPVEPEPVVADTLPAEPVTQVVEETVPEPEPPAEEVVPSVPLEPAAKPEPEPEERGYRWALKTNVAYLAATVANVAVEYSFGEHYSVEVPIIYSPYTVARDYRLRFLVFQPEFRYWLRRPLEGHFFGVHLHAGAFNISVDDETRYQSPDGFYGAGLSYGYALPFARHWAAEFTLGAGYVHANYDKYYNIPNGARYEKGISYNYWGLTRVGISIVYKFGK